MSLANAGYSIDKKGKKTFETSGVLLLSNSSCIFVDEHPAVFESKPFNIWPTSKKAIQFFHQILAIIFT